jgi:hypothetical protein
MQTRVNRCLILPLWIRLKTNSPKLENTEWNHWNMKMFVTELIIYFDWLLGIKLFTISMGDCKDINKNQFYKNVVFESRSGQTKDY